VVITGREHEFRNSSDYVEREPAAGDVVNGGDFLGQPHGMHGRTCTVAKTWSRRVTAARPAAQVSVSNERSFDPLAPPYPLPPGHRDEALKAGLVGGPDP
jgi:hypothetical protein